MEPLLQLSAADLANCGCHGILELLTRTIIASPALDDLYRARLARLRRTRDLGQSGAADARARDDRAEFQATFLDEKKPGAHGEAQGGGHGQDDPRDFCAAAALGRRAAVPAATAALCAQDQGAPRAAISDCTHSSCTASWDCLLLDVDVVRRAVVERCLDASVHVWATTCR